jgi:hypothetical protein
VDVLEDGAHLPTFDYVVMNGIFTRRHPLSAEAMDGYVWQLQLAISGDGLGRREISGQQSEVQLPFISKWAPILGPSV